MKPSTPSDVIAASQDYRRAAVDFIQTASWRLAAEDGLSAVSIRLLEADLTELMKKAKKFDEVFSRYPCPDHVPQWAIDGIQRQLAWGQHLIAGLRAIKPYVEFRSKTTRRDPKEGMGKQNKEGRNEN